MGMTGTVGNAVGKRRHRRAAVMSEINVTPMVDVMLVLLIIFMVSAPLLTVGVPIDLPQTQAKSLEQDQKPITLNVATTLIRSAACAGAASNTAAIETDQNKTFMCAPCHER